MSEEHATRFTLPSIFDLPADHPSRRNYDVQIAGLRAKMDRIEHLLILLVKQGTGFMDAVTDLTNAVGETVDEIDVVINHMAQHPAVQSDGQLASLTQRLRNTTAALRQAMSNADQPQGSVSGTAAGPSIVSAPDVGPDAATPRAPGGATDAAVAVRPDAGTGSATLTSTGMVGSPEAPASTDAALAELGNTPTPTSETTGTSGSPSGSTSSPAVPGPQTTRRTP